MKKYIIFYVTFILFLILAMGGEPKKPKDIDKDIKWKWGIAFKNGKAIYFDPYELDTIDFCVTHEYLTNQKKYYPIFPGGYVIWGYENNLVYIYLMPVTNFHPSSYIIKSEKIIHYKISNEAIYLKDDKTDWEKMEFRLIKEEPKPGVEFLIYLKSRWFEGEYYIYEP